MEWSWGVLRAILIFLGVTELPTVGPSDPGTVDPESLKWSRYRRWRGMRMPHPHSKQKTREVTLTQFLF